MSIVTKGLGGRSLICKGLGFLEFIKRIVEKITRWIPRRRQKVIFRIKVTGNPVFPLKDSFRVTGDLVCPFTKTIKVEGEKDFTPVIWFLLDEEDEDEMP